MPQAENPLQPLHFLFYHKAAAQLPLLNSLPHFGLSYLISLNNFISLHFSGNLIYSMWRNNLIICST